MDDNDLLSKIYTKVEKISDDMGDLKIISGKQQISLDEHVRRTEILENRTDVIFEELEPLKEHVIQVNTVFKIIAGLSTIGGVILGILKFIKKI